MEFIKNDDGDLVDDDVRHPQLSSFPWIEHNVPTPGLKSSSRGKRRFQGREKRHTLILRERKCEAWLACSNFLASASHDHPEKKCFKHQEELRRAGRKTFQRKDKVVSSPIFISASFTYRMFLRISQLCFYCFLIFLCSLNDLRLISAVTLRANVLVWYGMMALS